MAVIFSHPSYPTSDGYGVIGYNLMVSRAKGNTYSSAGVSAGSQTVTPASMANIVVGATLDIEPENSNYEQVVVTGVTTTTFTAPFVNAHPANFTIQSQILSPNFYGPWSVIKTNYASNLSIYDAQGSRLDLYRVQPIVQLNPGLPSQGAAINLSYSRAFYSTTPLYDAQISSLLQNFRLNYIDDVGVRSTDSTVITESTGQGIMPFITDANTSRFYLAFLPNTDPVKFVEEDVLVYSGKDSTSALPLVPYKDYFPNDEGGFIDFAVNPSADTYLKVEYSAINYTNNDCRNALINAVSELSLFGLTDQTYQVSASNNYLYLVSALPNRDVAQIVCEIARKNLLGSTIQSSFKAVESWKTKNVEYTADPSRSIQAGTLWHQSLKKQIQDLADNYIINTRTYFSRGEFDSFFDNSGLLYPPFSVYNVFNYMSWWL